MKSPDTELFSTLIDSRKVLSNNTDKSPFSNFFKNCSQFCLLLLSPAKIVNIFLELMIYERKVISDSIIKVQYLLNNSNTDVFK